MGQYAARGERAERAFSLRVFAVCLLSSGDYARAEEGELFVDVFWGAGARDSGESRLL